MGRCDPDPAGPIAGAAARCCWRRSAVVILADRRRPGRGDAMMVRGALGSAYGWGYTLYYATNFIFTGLAVAVAFHARLFNIGGEGQAMIGGLGVAPDAASRPLAALDGRACWPRSSARRCSARLGRDPGLSAGQARQPHRDHHDHVQFHRLGRAGLHAGQRVAGRRLDGPPKPRASPRRRICPTPRFRGRPRHRVQRAPTPLNVTFSWRWPACVLRLAADLAHAAGL
jgi:hypothetical protein